MLLFFFNYYRILALTAFNIRGEENTNNNFKIATATSIKRVSPNATRVVIVHYVVTTFHLRQPPSRHPYGNPVPVSVVTPLVIVLTTRG